MPELQKQSFRPRYNNELNIESIISAPLIAASKANVMMVTGQTRFLLEYCFTKKKDSDNYKPVMIEMTMYRSELVSGESPGDPKYIDTAELAFNVPLLCLVPLSSLAIDKVTVDFDMEITSVTSSQEKKRVGDNTIIDKKAQLNGKIGNDSATNKKRQMSSKLKVGINAGPLPLPVGVLTIIDLYSKSIQPLPKSGEEKEEVTRKKKKKNKGKNNT